MLGRDVSAPCLRAKRARSEGTTSPIAPESRKLADPLRDDRRRRRDGFYRQNHALLPGSSDRLPSTWSAYRRVSDDRQNEVKHTARSTPSGTAPPAPQIHPHPRIWRTNLYQLPTFTESRGTAIAMEMSRVRPGPPLQQFTPTVHANSSPAPTLHTTKHRTLLPMQTQSTCLVLQEAAQWADVS